MTATKVTSYAAGLDTPELQKLTAKHTQLLDTVDTLRGNNLGKYVEIPQIVVVGDQSSGKSSVLSAISQVQFPARGNICTRFATELSLRVADEPKLEATIRAHEDETEDIKEHLGAFKITQTEFDKLPEIIEAASKHMHIAEGQNFYSRHTLSIKISGPSVPQLTLVDLPGFYTFGRDNQPIEFAEVVKELAKEYMENKNSIILAVIAASYTTANQRILELIKQSDFSERALGIITKPDLMPRGGDSEAEILDLLKNRGSTFMRYGWHVLRNIGEGEAMDFEERDAQEEVYFAQKLWRNIPQNDRGIATLRKKLCDVLLMHIAEKLPLVAKRIDELVEQYDHKVTELPEARDEINGCQRYLLRLTEKFAQITRQVTGATSMTFDFDIAAQGDLTEAASASMEKRNLRARVRDMNKDFVMAMLLCGSKHIVQWRDPQDASAWIQPVTGDVQSRIVQRYGLSPSIQITQEEFEKYVDRLATLIRANELPDDATAKLVMPIFFEQSQPWGALANRHADMVLEETQTVVGDILKSITENDESTRANITDTFIKPFFTKRRKALYKKIQELLPLQHASRYPVAVELLYQYKLSKRQEKRRKRLELKQMEQQDTSIQIPSQANNPQAVKHITTVPEAGRTTSVLDGMMVYYNMTVQTFVTNVVMLAIENELMVQIPGIFTMDKVIRELGTAGQIELVRESSQSKIQREKLACDLENLKRGKELCNQWIKDNKSSVPISRPTRTSLPNGGSNSTSQEETNGPSHAVDEVDGVL